MNSRIAIIAAIATAAVGCGSGTLRESRSAMTASGVTPVLFTSDDGPGGNPTCADAVAKLNRENGLSLAASDYVGCKIDLGTSGGKTCAGITFTDVVTDGPSVAWSTDPAVGVDIVIVKGSDAANIYYYDPTRTSDSGLTTPINDSNNQNAGLSHVDFCVNPKLVVTKSASTSYKRAYDWTILKESTRTNSPLGTEADPLVLEDPQDILLGYKVTLTPSFTDSDFWVEGVVTVTNPWTNLTAQGVSISDVFNSGTDVTLDCGSFQNGGDIGPGETVTCTYGFNPGGKINAVNVATATTSAGSSVHGGTASADVTFGDPASTTNRCVTVTDDKHGSVGTACADSNDTPVVFTYDQWRSSSQPDSITACELNPTSGKSERHGTFVNTATIVELQKSSSVTIYFKEDCLSGCSLTLGYWKTHNASFGGGAPVDDTWNKILPSAEQSVFACGQTYYSVLWTAPKGDAWYNLAQQYIAAVLNGLKGADTSAAASALSFGNDFFSTCKTVNKNNRAAVLANATILNNYNNGLIGPGHCSE